MKSVILDLLKVYNNDYRKFINAISKGEKYDILRNKIKEETFFLDKFTNTPSYRIGLVATESEITAEEDGIELFRYKSQHVCSIKAKELIRKRKNELNAKRYQEIQELKSQGIL